MSKRVKESKARSKGLPWSFYQRSIGVLLQNPHIVQACLKHEFKRNIGMPLVRRFNPRRSVSPGLLSLNITRRCNLNCHMCIQHRHDRGDSSNLPWYDGNQDLPLSAWIDVLDQAARFRPVVNVIGGEPTLYPHFRELIQAIGERKLCFEVTTNGLLLTGLAEELVRQRPFIIFVSIDGPEDVHDEVRGLKGCFQKATEGIRALVEERKKQKKAAPYIFLNCTISKVNLDTIDQMVDLAVDLGVDTLQFLHVVFDTKSNVDRHNDICTSQWAQEHGFNLIAPSMPEGEYYEHLLTEEDVATLTEKIALIREQARGRMELRFIPELDSAKMTPYYFDLDYPFPNRCNSLWLSQRIMPDGSFSPCLHVVAGNIKEQSLLEMWNGEQMGGFRSLIDKGLYPACVRCCSRSF